MSIFDNRHGHGTDARNKSAGSGDTVAPGKRTRTMSLPPRAESSPPAPVQKKSNPAAGATRARPGAQTASWMNVAMRPDTHEAPVDAPVQRKAANAESTATLPASGTGKAMPEDVQTKMEGALGADFSAVRIHEGPRAESLGAQAYTQGTNVHFAPGQYQPDSRHGQELLGHELAHVVQQSQGRVRATTQAKGVGVNDDAGLEQEADRMGARAAMGEAINQPRSHGGVAGSNAPVQMMKASDVVAGSWYIYKGQRLWLVNFKRGSYEFSETENGEATITLTRASDFEPAPDGNEQDQQPVRTAFREARANIEVTLGRNLSDEEWEVIADFKADNIKDARNWGNPTELLAGLENASCIPTSERLYEFLKNGNENSHNDKHDLSARLEAVASAIEADNAAGVFRLQFGSNDHGFVVVVKDGYAELVQSFAGEHGETLATNLESDRYGFAAQEIAEHLRNLVNPDETEDAQTALFDGQIDDNGTSPIENMDFTWQRSDLPENISETVTDELQDRAKALFPKPKRKRNSSGSNSHRPKKKSNANNSNNSNI